MYISPFKLLINILPEPLLEPPHVGLAGIAAEADTRAVTTYSSAFNEVEVPIISYATAKRP